MSQLLTLDRPSHVSSRQLHTRRGTFAALISACETENSSGTVLLVPGFNGSKEDFLPLLGSLRTAAFTVYAIDQRGQYETGNASPVADYGAEALARDLVAIAEEVGHGHPVHMVGHSYGGLVARLAVTRCVEPQRTWASVTLVNFGPAAVSSWQRDRIALLEDVLSTATLAEVWPFLAPQEGQVSPEVLDFLARRWSSNLLDGVRAAVRQMSVEPDRTAELKATGVPVSVVCGSPDRTWPEDGVRRMAERLGCPYTELPGGGHSPNVHAPEAVAQALTAFWSAREPRQ